MISDDTYAVYRAAINKADEEIAHYAFAGIPIPETLPEYVRDVTNAIRGEVEVYELHRDKPAKVGAYAKFDRIGIRVAYSNPKGTLPYKGERGTLATWPGDILGTFIVQGRAWQDRHGNWRASIIALLPGIGHYRGQWVFTAQDCLTLKRIGDA